MIKKFGKRVYHSLFVPYRSMTSYIKGPDTPVFPVMRQARPVMLMVMVMVMEFNVGEPLALGATILGDHQKKQK